MKNKFIILVDSGCTMPRKLMDKNNIAFVPLSISDQNNKVYPDDGIAITQEQLVSRLESGETFKTSCTQFGILLQKVEELLETNEIVYFIPISSGISSQYNQGRMLEQEFEDRVYTINSNSTGTVTEYIAVEVNKYAQNENDPQKVVKFAENLFDKSTTYFSCENPKGLVSGGRVTKILASIITFLRLKPIVHFRVKNSSGGVGKNYKSNIAKMINLIDEDFGGITKTPEKIDFIGIYINSPTEEKKNFILDSIAKSFSFPKEKIIVRDVPAVVLAHTWKGSYGIGITCSTPIVKHREEK